MQKCKCLLTYISVDLDLWMAWVLWSLYKDSTTCHKGKWGKKFGSMEFRKQKREGGEEGLKH